MKTKMAQWWYCQEPDLFVDPPFSEDDWCKHHTWTRHAPQPKICLGVTRSLSPILLWVCLVSTFVCLYATQLQPKGWPVAVDEDYLQPFLLMSFALSLLLVFRTNSSYSRWWEARKMYGMVYHVCRDIARMVLINVPDNEIEIALEIVRWDSIFTAMQNAFINRDDSYYNIIDDLLTVKEREWLKQARQPPIAVLHIMSQLLAKSSLSDYQRMAIERRITALDLCVGSCERISKQPIPLAYTRHTSRLLVTFVTFLPFALWEGLQWLTIPTVAVLTFLLVGIENIGIQIEEPFRILPLRSFAVATRSAVEEVLVQHKIAQGMMMGAMGEYNQGVNVAVPPEVQNGMKK